jgi:hypothetical protein
MACEECWGDAWMISLHTGRTQTECYEELLQQRKDNPCTKEEQEGQWKTDVAS